MKKVINVLTGTVVNNIIHFLPKELLEKFYDEYRDLTYTVKIITINGDDYGFSRMKVPGDNQYSTAFMVPHKTGEWDDRRNFDYTDLTFAYNPFKPERVVARDVLVAIMLGVVDLSEISVIEGSRLYNAVVVGKDKVAQSGQIQVLCDSLHLDDELTEHTEDHSTPRGEPRDYTPNNPPRYQRDPQPRPMYAAFHGQLSILNPMVEVANYMLGALEKDQELDDVVTARVGGDLQQQVRTFIGGRDISVTYDCPSHSLILNVNGKSRIIVEQVGPAMSQTLIQIIRLFDYALHNDPTTGWGGLMYVHPGVRHDIEKYRNDLLGGRWADISGAVGLTEPKPRATNDYSGAIKECRRTISFDDKSVPSLEARIACCLWFMLDLESYNTFEELCDTIQFTLRDVFDELTISRVGVNRRLASPNSVVITFDTRPILEIKNN